MKIKKDLFVVALATFCLTATLFMVIPTRSEWDPWADLKEDGTVDIYDAIVLSNAFGTSGDTTKNVNVTDYPGVNSYAYYYSYNDSFFGINGATFSPPAPQNYTDAVAINVLDMRRNANGSESGIYVISIGGFFAFSPKQNFLRVSNFSYTISAFKPSGGELRYYNFTLSVDYHAVKEDHFEIFGDNPTSRSNYADAAVSWIKPGLNFADLQFYEYLWIMKMDVYIEYEYQA